MPTKPPPGASLSSQPRRPILLSRKSRRAGNGSRRRSQVGRTPEPTSDLCSRSPTGLRATTCNGLLVTWSLVSSPLYGRISPAPADFGEGITIGAVVVPQGMAYALLAKLEVQFGLYSSFMGVLVYWFFATSKDITIGVRYSSPPKFWHCVDP